MKVCYLFQDQYPWDVRVDKIMNSLADHGIEGHIISRNQDRLIQKEQLRENLYIHRMPSFSNRRVNELINFPAFFSPFWLKTILSVVKSTSCDLIIVRDLPLSPTALIAGKLTSVPVLMDMAENYPAMIMDTWKYRGPKPIDRLVRNPWALKALERIVLPKLDGILVVSKYSAERVVKVGCNKAYVWIVNNTPRLNELQRYRKLYVADDLRTLSDFIILYVGGLEETRGIETVIRALPEIINEIHDALFIIVGKGTSEARLKNLVHILGIDGHVVFKGWVEHQMLPSIMDISDVCLVPHFVTEHTETTIPNKIFDYMAQKKPVVVTNAKALKELVESCHCGMVYNHNDHHHLAKLIINLKDNNLRDQLGRSGCDAVKTRYNWSVDEKALLSAVRELSLPNL